MDILDTGMDAIYLLHKSANTPSTVSIRPIPHPQVVVASETFQHIGPDGTTCYPRKGFRRPMAYAINHKIRSIFGIIG